MTAQRPRAAVRVSQIPKSAIHEMTRLSKSVPDVAFLSWARPTAGTPAHIRDAAIDAIRDGRTGGYSETPGLLSLRQAIVEKLKRDNNIDATPEQIIVTVGAIEGLSAAVFATVDPGDEVLLFPPTQTVHP